MPGQRESRIHRHRLPERRLGHMGLSKQRKWCSPSRNALSAVGDAVPTGLPAGAASPVGGANARSTARVSESASRSIRSRGPCKSNSATASRVRASSRAEPSSRTESPAGGDRRSIGILAALVARASPAADASSARRGPPARDHGGRHRAERPHAVERAREHVHQALVPERERRLQDVEWRRRRAACRPASRSPSTHRASQAAPPRPSGTIRRPPPSTYSSGP